jgi:hypothetical protein
MTETYQIICEHTLRRLLRTAAVESMREAVRHCRRVGGESSSAGVLEQDEALAWIAGRATQDAWALLPVQDPDTMAPLAWAIQEVVEWASHVARLESVGDTECRGPITWLPQGDHPLGTRNLNHAVDERLDLLRRELLEHRLIVLTDPETEVAA